MVLAIEEWVMKLFQFKVFHYIRFNEYVRPLITTVSMDFMEIYWQWMAKSKHDTALNNFIKQTTGRLFVFVFSYISFYTGKVLRIATIFPKQEMLHMFLMIIIEHIVKLLQDIFLIWYRKILCVWIIESTDILHQMAPLWTKHCCPAQCSFNAIL